MIIEGAFHKLHENLLMDSFPREQYEAFLVGHMAMAILLEMTLRNEPYPASRIRLEKPYAIAAKAGRKLRADLFAETPLSGKLASKQCEAYGIAQDNWFEVKYFRRSAKSKSGIPRQKNARRIAIELLRLCVLVEDSGGGARFILSVFEGEPESYVAPKTRENKERHWLRQMLTPGYHEICLDFSEEPDILQGTDAPLVLNASIDVKAFIPVQDKLPALYWGYLCNVINFKLSLGNQTIIHSPDDPIDKTQAGRDAHLEVARKLIDGLST
jgi:hypothetical protein